MIRGAHLLPAARALACLRVFFGVILALAGTAKMAFIWLLGFLPIPMAKAAWQRDFPERLAGWIVAHPSGVLAAVIRDLVLPHGAAVAGLIAWLQLIAGVLLIVGFFTRVASGIAALLAGALMLTAVAAVTGARIYVFWGVLALVLLLGDAGQTWGMDGWRREVKRGNEF